MTSDLDIYRSANELIKQHGDDAPMDSLTGVASGDVRFTPESGHF